MLTDDGYMPRINPMSGLVCEFGESENMIQISKEGSQSNKRIVSGGLLPFDMPIINSYGSLCVTFTRLFAKLCLKTSKKCIVGHVMPPVIAALPLFPSSRPRRYYWRYSPCRR